jgi:hypothetical protein
MKAWASGARLSVARGLAPGCAVAVPLGPEFIYKASIIIGEPVLLQN